jgi:UDP-N-acetylglucosamine transferase subunit ALG13
VTHSDRLVVGCLVGTDHHPFDRLVSWCDALAEARPDVDVVVQYGRSTAPTVATGQPFLSREELADLLARAHVAVSHGGPGLISEIRAAGLQPVAVARDPDHGEHVDGHQLRFIDRMGRAGIVEVATTQPGFVDIVTARLADPYSTVAGVDGSHVAASVSRFAGLVEDLLERRDAQRWRTRR